MTKTVNKAKEFAKKAHEGQVRKGNGQPYFNHPQTVYEIAKSITDDVSILAACYLHDTIEDTPINYIDLKNEFGKEIADIVQAVSEDKSIKHWAVRKSEYLETVFSNEKAVIVAWADKMHNVADLKTVKDFSVFNETLEEKIKFYRKFADMMKQRDLKKKLKLLIDNVY